MKVARPSQVRLVFIPTLVLVVLAITGELATLPTRGASGGGISHPNSRRCTDHGERDPGRSGAVDY